MNPKEQRDALVKELEGIVAKAQAEGRDLTADEAAEVEKKAAEVDKLTERIERGEKSKALLARVAGMKGDVDPQDEEGVKAATLGDHVAKALGDRLVHLKGQRFSLASGEFKASSDVQVRPSSLAPAYTDVDTRLVTGVRRRLTIADLLGSETISGAALTYFVDGALEGAPAAVAEGGKKPQIHFADPTAVTESLKKLAGFLKESDEIIEDLPWLVSAINGRLVYHLQLIEEDQLLNGSGTGNNLTGILNRAGIQTEAAADQADNADSIFRAAMKVATGSGLDADGIVIHPLDYQALRLSKDANGQYFGGGFFTGQYGQGGVMENPPIWGLRTVVTPAITPGTVLVGAFSQAGSVIRKGGISVEMTNSDGEDFVHNRVTIRAEERLALAVRRPAGFVEVTLAGAEEEEEA